MTLSAKTTNKKVLNQKIREAEQVNQNLEASLNCLIAAIYKRLPIMEDRHCSQENHIPFFEIQGYGIVGIREANYVVTKKKLTTRDKINNIRNGYTKEGFARQANSGVRVSGRFTRFVDWIKKRIK